jgi:acid phosphatase family membrane protein YuiD
MAMLETNEPMFDGPIPGESLTAELGARPWQSPPQYANVDDVIDYYMSRMSQEDFMVQLVDVLEMGAPVSAIANSIQLSGVMQGLHTIDSGILVMPIIMEMIMMLGDAAGVKYESGVDNPDKNKTRETLLTKVAMNYDKKLKEIDVKEVIEEKEEEPDVQYSSGLMARRK